MLRFLSLVLKEGSFTCKFKLYGVAFDASVIEMAKLLLPWLTLNFLPLEKENGKSMQAVKATPHIN